MINLAPKPPVAADTPEIFTVNAENFQPLVLMGSIQRPVLAYFTASWCGPCKQLRPALEKVVLAQAGKVALAVIDIDQNPELAAAMRVQSVPQVYAFVGAQPVDGFAGAVPESQLKTFIANVLKMAGLAAEEEAAEIAEAAATPRADWEDGNLVAAMAGFKEIKNEKAAEFLKNLIPLGAANVLPAAEAAATKTPDSQHALALAALAQGKLEQGFDALLASIKADRKWNDERARQDFVLLSEILGLEDPLVVASRKKLSSILFS
jgi:putative thioredoxin